MELTWYGSIMLIAGVASLAIGQYVWHRRLDPESFWFALLMHSIASWSLFSAFEAVSKTLGLKIFFSVVSYSGVASIATLWFLLSARYCQIAFLFRRPAQIALWTVPSLVFLAALTNGWHGLLWPRVTLVPGTDGLVAAYCHGPIVYFHIVYSYCLLAVGTGGFLRTAYSSSRLFSRQGAIISLAVLIPWAANFFYLTGLSPNRVDLTPAAFCMTGVLFFFGFLRYRLLGITPVARGVLFRDMEDEVLVIDEEGRVVDLNPAAQRSFGISLRDVGKRVEELFKEWPSLTAHCGEGAADRDASVSLETNRGDTWFDVQLSPLRGFRGRYRGSLLVFRNISARKRLEEELVQLASLDTLTGVYNRRIGLSILEQQLRFSERNQTHLTICFMDINDLKRVNDNFGHAEGDLFIQRIVSIVKAAMRDSDILARLGGDEFLAILPDCTTEQSQAVWSRIKEKLAEAALAEAKPIPYRVACGFAEYAPGGKPDFEMLLARADSEMYRNKDLMKKGNAE